MIRILYIDASNSGISGDMFLAALLDLIPNAENILLFLTSIKDYLKDVSNFNIRLNKIERSGILLNQLSIDIKESKKHRTAKVLRYSLNNFLEDKGYSIKAKEYANRVMDTLINAEASVHGKSADKIHLHELSSIDTLLDILGVTKALEELGYFKNEVVIYCSTLPLGGGTIKTAHGLLPVPAPATAKILEGSNLKIINGPIDSELVTPTGAALLTNLKPIVDFPKIILDKMVSSTGQKSFKNFPNVLRLFHGNSESESFSGGLKQQVEAIAVLETDIDDVSGEIIGNFIQVMEIMGVLDIQLLPTITKKNRPGHLIKILCNPSEIFIVIEKIIEELGTLGVRFNIIKRVCINRELKTIKLDLQGQQFSLGYKLSFITKEGVKKIINIKPEFDDLKKISNALSKPLREIQKIALLKINSLYEE